MSISGPAKALVKIALAACAAFWLYSAFAMPYERSSEHLAAAVYFAVAFAVIWIGDRIARRFASLSWERLAT